MESVKIMVVEDEMIIADHLCQTLESLGYQVTEPAIQYDEAVRCIREEKPDLALLDIQLAGKKTGLDLAQTINEEFKIPFIFLTSHSDPKTISEAKKHEPFAYLVKPFTKEDLYASIELAMHNFSAKRLSGADSSNNDNSSSDLTVNDALFIKQGQLFVKVKLDEIQYLKSDHVYVEVFTLENKKMVVRSSLKDLSAKLPDNFFRIHRSYVINLDFLDAIGPQDVIISGKEIPLAKNFKGPLMEKVHYT